MLRQYFLRQYFAQALLNKGVLSREQVVCLLASKDEHQSTIAMRALSQKVMTAAQIEEILKREQAPEKFGALAVADGYMTPSQLRSLEEMESNTNLDFSQGMIDEKIVDYRALEALLLEYENNATTIIDNAVQQIAAQIESFKELEDECALYSGYVDAFLRAMAQFMRTSPVINFSAEPFSGEKGVIVISQRLTGDVSLTAGIMAEEDVFRQMAQRYSQEPDIEYTEEIVIDSVAEFLNVTNGLYLINLSNRHYTVDLAPHRVAYNIIPAANKQLVIPINADFGSFQLILAADEIAF